MAQLEGSLSLAFPQLSAQEYAAHQAITDARHDFRRFAIGPSEYKLRVSRAVDHIAPRCNCGLVLNRKPQLGRICWSCSCGWSCLEVR